MPHAPLVEPMPTAPGTVERSPSIVAAPEISVCIANWNCREFLRACLESLRRQAMDVRLEVIVVDNASTDGAAEMVEQAFPEVVLLRNEVNQGFARASNQAAARARAPLLLFLNNDTVVPVGSLRKLVDGARAHPEAGLIGPRLCDPDGRTQASCRPRPTVATLLHRTTLLRWTGLLRRRYRRYRRDILTEASRVQPVETLMGAAVLMPRHVFTTCGGWDEKYAFGGEDLELSWRIGRHYPLIYLSEVTIIHHSRCSTRANVAYSAPRVAVGFARYLRHSGTSARALLLYKLVVSLDAPVQLLSKGLQSLGRLVLGQPTKARQSWQRVREQWYFLTRGLVPFWRA